jgi:hypothetical protein
VPRVDRSLRIEKRYLHAAGKVIWAALSSRLFTDRSQAKAVTRS